ncbi:transcriptional regulator [Streptomyces sp. NPDC002825]|uniref:winged helix-turn-helix domain-containing protein n=1 Tax=Streptomyces sp. NPDC002825 TaxID=3154666 RepID=UPI00332EE57F
MRQRSRRPARHLVPAPAPRCAHDGRRPGRPPHLPDRDRALPAGPRRSGRRLHPDAADVVHQRVRPGILTVVHQARRVEFGFLRTALDLTAGNPSRHLAVLEQAGLVEIDKGYEGKRPRTWLSLTPAGARALQDEVTRLKRLVQRIERGGPAPES